MAAATTNAAGRAALASGVWERLRAVADDASLAAEEHRIMRGAGINGGPLRALLYLPLTGSMPMRELASLMGCDNSYVTSLIDILEQHGFALREAHPTDRRVKVIILTETGQEVAAQVQHAHATPPKTFDVLTKTDLATLDKLLRKIQA